MSNQNNYRICVQTWAFPALLIAAHAAGCCVSCVFTAPTRDTHDISAERDGDRDREGGKREREGESEVR